MAIFGVGMLLAVIDPSGAAAVERTATPSTFSSVFAASAGGDTVLLASGSYGTFGGALKSGMVTIKPQPGASATMALNFNPATNITIEGLTLTSIQMADSQTKNITVRGSTISGQTTLRTGQLGNSNILFDGNVHGPWSKCSNCAEGRVWLPERRNDVPSGITIRNSRFGPGGNSDGIQNGSNGTVIENNEFVGIKQIDGADGVHADSIQLYGSKNTVIRGNWFHDVSVGIMCADQCDHELVEDNVFAVNGSPYAVTWLSDSGSVFRHNTFLDYGICDYNQRCGTLYLGNKDVDPPSQGTVLKDNILTRVCVCDGSSSGLAEDSHNLYTQRHSGGASNLTGSPTYIGGANPQALAGFRLAPGSLGSGNASDGADRGARIGRSSSPLPPVSGTPSPTVPHRPGVATVRCSTSRKHRRIIVTCKLRGDASAQRARLRLIRGGRVIARGRGPIRDGRLPTVRMRAVPSGRARLVVRLAGGRPIRLRVRL